MMLEQHAIVLRVEGDKAWVEARESGTCGSCGSGGCSTRRLADLFGMRQRAWPVDNSLNIQVGEYVVIGMPPGALWRAALRLYGLPLMLALAGALAGQRYAGDVGAAGGLLAGLLASAALWKLFPAGRHWQPVMLRREGARVAFQPF